MLLDAAANISRFWQQDSRVHLHTQRWTFTIIQHHIHISSSCQQTVYQWGFNFPGQQLATRVENMFLTLCWPGTNLRPRLYIDKVEIKLTAGINYNIYTWTPGRGGTFAININVDSVEVERGGRVHKNKQDTLTILGLVCDQIWSYWKTLETLKGTFKNKRLYIYI